MIGVNTFGSAILDGTAETAREVRSRGNYCPRDKIVDP